MDKALEWIRWLRYLQPRGGEKYAPNYRFSVDELFGMYNIERGGALAGVLEYFDCVVWSAPRAIGPDQLEQITPAMEPGIALTLKKCGTCQQQVGRQKAPCDACKDYHPQASATQTLIVSLAGILKFMQHLETYAVLVKQQGVPSGDDPQRPITTGPRLEVYPGEMMVAVHRTGCDLASTDPLGREVGFRDAHSFHSNGRCPYVIPLEIVPYDASGEDPVLLWMMAFHAPFSGGEGMRARALDKAMTIGLVPALTGNVGKTAFGELDRAVLIGDLNLDYRPGGSTGSAPNQWYSSMQGRGFAVGIPGVRTSLKKILKGAKARTFHEEWKSDYRSSAYDNVLTRGSWADRGVLQCAVVDVVAWIEANLQDFPLPTGCPAQDVRYFNGLSARERAIFIYQMFVSDHLPVVIDILVKPLSLNALAAIRKMDTQRRERSSRVVMRRLVMMWEHTAFLHPLALIGAGAYASGPDITLLVGTVAGVDGANVGVVAGERRAIFKFGEVAPPQGTTVVLGYLNPTFEGEALVGQPDFVDYVLPKDEKIRCIDSRLSLWFMAATVIEQGRDRFFRMQAGQVTSGLAFVKPGWDPPPRDGDTVVVLFREPRQVVA